MGGGAGMGYPYQTGNPGGYQGHSHGGGAYYGANSHSSNHPYGPVYYNVAQSNEGGHAVFDRKSVGELTLNEFFSKCNDLLLNTTDYNSFAPLVHQLHLPLPVTSSGNAEYAAARHGGGIYGNQSSHHGQDLPSIPALRTKQDLLKVKQAIQEMTNTANAMGSNAHPLLQNARFGNDRHVSPHHAMATTGIEGAGADHGMGSPTPSLTPAGSSAVSNTSSHSPASSHSQTVSPTTGNGMHIDGPTASTIASMQATHATSGAYPDMFSLGNGHRAGYPNPGSMYPSLSSAAGAAGMSAPVPTLGSSYDPLRRRHSGGRLQSGQPDRSAPPASNGGMDDAEMSSPSADMAIDPALDPALGGPSSGRTSGSATPTQATTATAPVADDASPTGAAEGEWLDNVRKLDQISQLINALLEHGVHEDDDDENGIKAPMHEDEAAAGSGNDDSMDVDKVTHEEDSLYPKLNP